MTAVYPDPSNEWKNQSAPPLYVEEYEAEDGDRRLLEQADMDMVPYSEQVQRLMAAVLAEARRARRHTIALGPKYWALEPGDSMVWYSDRNGYDAKRFRLDGIYDLPSGDIFADITEVNPADYAWDASSNYTNISTGTLTLDRVPAQGFSGWGASPYSITDEADVERRPGVILEWAPRIDAISGIRIQGRVAATGAIVMDTMTPAWNVGAVIISEGLSPDVAYEFRAIYVPTDGRSVLWSAWLTVTTYDIRVGFDDLDTSITDDIQQAIDDAENVQESLEAAVISLTVDYNATQVAAGNAATARDQSEAARDQANTARDTAVAEALAASGSATTASNAAATAAASENAAGNSAGAAATSASGAATSATDAGTAASAAASSSVEAQAGAELSGIFATGNLCPDPNAANFADWGASLGGVRTQVTHGQSGAGSDTAIHCVIDADGSSGIYTPWAVVGPISSRNIRVSFKLRSNSGAGAVRCNVSTRQGTGSQSLPSSVVATTDPTSSFVEYEAELLTSSNVGDQLRVRIYMTDASGGEWFETTDVVVRDITISQEAEDSASASASSASSAAASETAAGQEASAAQVSRTGADTARSGADTAESNAATSETNAAGSASSAGSSANNAANSENAAGASAGAASGSANAASSSANDAGQSATAASNSENSASTSAGQASTSAGAAATSESNADGSANTAAIYSQVAARMLSGGMAGHPTFDVWGSGQNPDGFNISANGGASWAKNTADAKFIHCVELSTASPLTTGSPYLEIRGNYAGNFEINPNDTDVVLVSMDIELVSGAWGGARLQTEWRGGNNKSNYIYFAYVNIPETLGIIQTLEFIVKRPSDYDETGTASYLRAIFRNTSSAAGGHLENTVRVHRMDVKAITAQSAAGLALAASTDLDGFSSAFAGLTAISSGGEISGIRATSWTDPDGTGGSLLELLGSLVKVGSLSADRLTTGANGTNYIYNSRFEAGLSGFYRGQNGAAGAQTSLSLRAAGASWAGEDYPTLLLYQGGTETAGYTNCEFRRVMSDGSETNRAFPVTPGEWYGAAINA